MTVIGMNVTRKQMMATYHNEDYGNPHPAPRQKTMLFVTIEDETRLAETAWFPEAFRRIRVSRTALHFPKYQGLRCQTMKRQMGTSRARLLCRSQTFALPLPQRPPH